MDKILHHFETMGIHCLLIFTGKIIIPGVLRWCRISSIHSSAHGSPCGALQQDCLLLPWCKELLELHTQTSSRVSPRKHIYIYIFWGGRFPKNIPGFILFFFFLKAASLQKQAPKQKERTPRLQTNTSMPVIPGSLGFCQARLTQVVDLHSERRGAV